MESVVADGLELKVEKKYLIEKGMQEKIGLFYVKNT
jgi:hypothetical protein